MSGPECLSSKCTTMKSDYGDAISLWKRCIVLMLDYPYLWLKFGCIRILDDSYAMWENDVLGLVDLMDDLLKGARALCAR